jgi:hypothetical protein
MWQKNHATLHHGGETIFYNKKNVQTSKSKAANKAISFYYVMLAGMPPPSIPSDQAFYQSLWDDPERSNYSLKRTAPAQATNKKECTPPTKKVLRLARTNSS